MTTREKKRSDAECRDIIENEGIGYAVMSYMHEDSVSNKKTAALWKAARQALEALETHLNG